MYSSRGDTDRLLRKIAFYSKQIIPLSFFMILNRVSIAVSETLTQSNLEWGMKGSFQFTVATKL